MHVEIKTERLPLPAGMPDEMATFIVSVHINGRLQYAIRCKAAEVIRNRNKGM